MGQIDFQRYRHLTFEDFKKLALDPSLPEYERIGFPAEYRRGFDALILSEMRAKVPALDRHGARVIDLGCGCGALVRKVMKHARSRGVELTLVDSKEVLDQVPDVPGVRKLPGRFPSCLPELLSAVPDADGVLCYSVLQHVFFEGSLFDFVDKACLLLGHQGTLLLGDIPNVSRWFRFFSSPKGLEYHKKHGGGRRRPKPPSSGALDRGLDDSVVLGMMMRYRGLGYDAFVLPQDPRLPLSGRREDLLVVRP